MLRAPCRILALLTLLLVAGCITARGSGNAGGDPNVLTRDEIEPYIHLSAYEAVRQTRPRWIQTRPPLEPAVVHVDGSPRGGLEVLESLRAADVERIVFRSASDATTRYGTGYRGGVIEVTTRNEE